MNPTQQPFFGRKISKTGVNVTQATDNQLILKEDYDQGNTIYYDDSGVPNVLIGKRPLTGIRGFYVSDTGVDITKATDAQLVFNSQQNIFKIVNTGNVVIPAYGKGPGAFIWDNIIIPHNLPYTPILNAYGLVTQFYNVGYPSINITPIQAYVTLPFDAQIGALMDSNLTRYQIICGVDASNVYISWYYSTTSSGAGGTGYNFPAVPVKYELLQNTIN